MHINLVPESPLSDGDENFMTATDVFSCFLFAYPRSNQDAKTTAKVINNIMTKLAYLTTTAISKKGSAFKSHVSRVVAGVLGITLKHANVCFD